MNQKQIINRKLNLIVKHKKILRDAKERRKQVIEKLVALEEIKNPDKTYDSFFGYNAYHSTLNRELKNLNHAIEYSENWYYIHSNDLKNLL